MDDYDECLDFDSNVFTFGNNKNGQLGIGLATKGTGISQKVDVTACKQVSYFGKRRA